MTLSNFANNDAAYVMWRFTCGRGAHESFFFLFVIGSARLHCQDRLKKNARSQYAWKKKNYSLKVLAYGTEGNNEPGSLGSFLLLLAASAILLCCRVENKSFIKTNNTEIQVALLYTSHKT